MLFLCVIYCKYDSKKENLKKYKTEWIFKFPLLTERLKRVKKQSAFQNKGGNLELACDITQETFLEIIRTIDKLNEPVAFVAWMKKITYHQCTRYFKKKKDVLAFRDDKYLSEEAIYDSIVEEASQWTGLMTSVTLFQ